MDSLNMIQLFSSYVIPWKQKKVLHSLEDRKRRELGCQGWANSAEKDRMLYGLLQSERSAHSCGHR